MINFKKSILVAISSLGISGNVSAGGFRLLNQDAEAFARGAGALVEKCRSIKRCNTEFGEPDYESLWGNLILRGPFLIISLRSWYS